MQHNFNFVYNAAGLVLINISLILINILYDSLYACTRMRNRINSKVLIKTWDLP